MAYRSSTDVIITVFASNAGGSVLIGTESPYTRVPHPGSNRLIEGWIWDDAIWPTDQQLASVDFAPSIFDPSSNFIPDSLYKSGIGNAKDLILREILEEQTENLKHWVPRIHHGHFYVFDQEWYLFSDDLTIEVPTDTISGSILYKDLQFEPKPGVPIHVRQYEWNDDRGGYEPVLDLRKRAERFTGLVVNEEEQDTTIGSGDFLVNNIDTHQDEFMIKYDHTPPRVFINQNYIELVGEGDPEIIGLSDGVTNEFNIRYSPIVSGELLRLFTWPRGDFGLAAEWTRIDSTEEFTPGSGTEFKLDETLGLITFGDYDHDTTSGAGMVPNAYEFIGVTYWKGVQIEYEPDNSRDWVTAKGSDVNPLHNSIHKGFIKISSDFADPRDIVLSAVADGSASEGYDLFMGNETTEVVALVTDAYGDPIEGITVTFELLETITGTFTNLQTVATAVTDENGRAHVFYAPPTTMDDLGRVTTWLTDNGMDTTVTVSGLPDMGDPSGVFIYEVRDDDHVLGIPEGDVAAYYTSYLAGEGILENPDGASASQAFEEAYRETHELLVPETYSATDLLTGSKRILLAVDASAVDPNHAIQKPTVIAPLIPTSMANVGSAREPVLELVYDGLLDLPGTNDIKSYLVVSTGKTNVRAYVTSERSSKKLFSNIVEMRTNIPPEANGVLVAQELTDINAELFKRVQNIDEISDAFITTTTGVLWEEYLSDRTSEFLVAYSSFAPDANTVALYTFNDGTVADTSSFARTSTAVNDFLPYPSGLVEEAFGTIGINGGYLEASGLWKDLNLQSGTVDMFIKTDRDTVLDGTDDISLFSLTVEGSEGWNALTAGIEVSVGDAYLTFGYAISGVDTLDYDAYFSENLSDIGVDFKDGQWHQYRLTWHWDEGDLTLRGFVDGIEVSSGTAQQVGVPRPVHSDGDIQNDIYAVNFDNAVSGVYVDEVRYSSTIRSDIYPDTSETLTFETYNEWFRRTRKASSRRLGLVDVTFSGVVPARIPLGFRLKSTGVTVASMLDRVTFYNPNDYLPEDYF